jgi:hypothetical protein
VVYYGITTEPDMPSDDHAPPAALPAIGPDERARQRDLARIDQAEAAERRNADFVQVARRSMDELGQLAIRAPKAMGLLVMIAKRMGRQNALVASYDTLQQLTGLSRATVQRSLKLLRDERWITTLRVGSASAYVVNAAVMWTTHGHLKSAAFTATVVTTERENPEAAHAKPPKLKHLPFLEPGERAVLHGEPPDPPAQDLLDLT